VTLAQDIQRHVGVDPDGIIGPATLQAIAKALGLHSALGGERMSEAGLAIIKASEGLRLKAYRDTGGVLTIGYGHTGTDVKPDMVITEARADELLREDVAEAEADVRRLCPVTTQSQFDALCSFTFNLGGAQLKTSTLRRLHNEGNYAGASDQFSRWVFDNGVKLNGLVKRRAAEARLYRGQA
jgi:lysozyme